MPRTLSVLLLLIAAAVAAGQPPPAAGRAVSTGPTVRAGEVVLVPAGKYADVSIDVPAGASVVWRFYPPPLQRSQVKSEPGRAIFAGEIGRAYVVTAVVIDFDKKTVTDVEFETRFGFTPPPDPKQPDPKIPDPKQPVPASFYFLVVRADGPASPAFTKAMGLPEWDALRAAGHKVKDRTVAEATPLLGGLVLPPGQLPCVVTLAVSEDGKTSTVARPPVPLPLTGAGVADLPKGVR